MVQQPEYRVQEIFYSIQGEGANVGLPVIFIRLAGCNLNCSFCDTNHEGRLYLNAKEIADMAIAANPECKNVLLTGGEPALQIDDNLIDMLYTAFNWIGVETNGTVPINSKVDYVTVSPKSQTKIEVKQNINEIRVPLKYGDNLPGMKYIPKADHYYLSPIFEREDIVDKNIYWVLEKIKENPKWKLSIQIHKLIGIK